MNAIANFLFEVGMLQKTPRSGFQFLGSGAQSVAEHSHRSAVIGYCLAQMDKSVDGARVVLMCLLHDVPEARTGDLNYVNKKYAQVDEARAIADGSAELPFAAHYRAALAEFGGKDTPEARLAHDADQLEMILALKEQKDRGNRYAERWYPYSFKRLCTAAGQRLAEVIWTTDSSAWWFDDDGEWWVNGTRQQGGSDDCS